MSRRIGTIRPSDKVDYIKDVRALQKQEGNNVCADCKTSPRPEWTSITFGTFICINCSGLHRRMGVHISRVKSLALDEWNQKMRDQMCAWGNIKANKFWEAKLKPQDRIPNQSKMESFINTKYQTGKWRFWDKDPIPGMFDDEVDDNVPLNQVQEKAKLKRESSLRAASTSSQPILPPPKARPAIDLIDHITEFPVRPSTTDANGIKPPPPKAPAAPKPVNNTDSLLGLGDIYGAPPPVADVRPSSSASTPSDLFTERKKLTNQILSMYTLPQQPARHERQASAGMMQAQIGQQQSGFGSLDDAFGNLKMNSPMSPPPSAPITQQQPKPDPFASFSAATSQRSSVGPPKVTSPVSGGLGFFDQKPKSVPKPAAATKPPQAPASKAESLLFDDFGSFSSAAKAEPPSTKPATTTAAYDLFDFAEPSPPARVPPPSTSKTQPPNISSAFNLSASAPPSQLTPKPSAPLPKSVATNGSSMLSNMDAWGSSNAWATPEPTSSSTVVNQSKPAAPSTKPSISTSNDSSAWGDAPTFSNHQTSSFNNGTSKTPVVSQSSAFGSGFSDPSTMSGASTFDSGFGYTLQAPPQVTPDEDFGGWNSAAPATPVASKQPPPQSQSKPPQGGGLGGGDDLFSNVWE